jgi:hypothetical protein
VSSSEHEKYEGDSRGPRMLFAGLLMVLAVLALWWCLGRTTSTEATVSARAAVSDQSTGATGYAQRSAAPIITHLRVSPSLPGRHDRILVSFRGRRATGDLGRERRSYTIQAWSVHPASACVNNRFRVLAARPAGYRLRGRLDPERGDGGSLGWCRGRFKGKVIYSVSYACPAKDTCRPPEGFRRHREVAARFPITVR